MKTGRSSVMPTVTWKHTEDAVIGFSNYKRKKNPKFQVDGEVGDPDEASAVSVVCRDGDGARRAA